MIRHAVNLAKLLIIALIIGCNSKKNNENTEQILSATEDTLSVQIKNKLIELRIRSKKEKWRFIPSYTDVLNSDLKEITGAILPLNFDQHVVNQNSKTNLLLKKLKVLRKEIFPSPSAASFDWRKLNGGTRVKNQGRCGSCWVFGTHAALEGSWRIKFSEEICSSEQNSLDWNGKANCRGGWPSYVCDFLMSDGSSTCMDYPNTISNGNRKPISKPYSLKAWAYVGKKVACRPSISSKNI
jgi:C1A family cysteine protease